MTYNDSGYMTFEASAAIAQYARVKIGTDGKVSAAGLADIWDGVAVNPAFASGDLIAIKLRNAPGSFPMIASEAVEVGDMLYTAASGKVSDTAASTAYQVGRAKTAGTADTHIVEVIPFVTGAANA